MYQHPVLSPLRQRRIAKSLLSLICLVLLGALFPVGSIAQSLTEPRKEQTLNGLQVLISSNPAAQDVMLKLRVHSGAAFDLAGKDGTMALLAEALFPEQSTREYISEELGGRLSTDVGYDSLEITLTGRSQDFERLVELLRTALVSTPLDKESVANVKSELEKSLSGSKPSAADRADAAVRARLYGNFPYSRPLSGTLESVARIDRADLMFARERFLNPNNATLVVAGNVQPDRVMRTLRQLLGGWRKSDKMVPATFRQPPTPDERILIVEPANGDSVELRFAVRGVSKGTRDEITAQVLANVLENRLKSRASNPGFRVTSEANLLPGVLILSTSVPYSALKSTLSAIRSETAGMAKTAPSPTELANAKAALRPSLAAKSGSIDQVADTWLDSYTYKSPALKDQLTQLDQTSPGDVQDLASRIFSATPAVVAVGDAEAITKELGPEAKIERSVVSSTAKPTVNPK